jgi:NSS family neurotransmitter:Na+ symporter
MADPSQERFSSRLGLLLSVLGIAVGTGNIWRFPRIVAQNGGEQGAGAFLLAWLVCLLSWSIPLIIAEYALGRRGRMGVVGSFARLAGPRLAWMGGFVALVATAIMFYYSVVAGWCAYYFLHTLGTPLPRSVEAAQGVWDGFQQGTFPLLFHAVAMGGGALVVARGVRAIERVNTVLIPVLFGIVLLAVTRALTLEGASAGVALLFTPHWPDLARPQLWLEALTQNAWDTGAGWGLILTYAVYMRRDDRVVQSAFITGFGNNTVSLLAAITVFGTVFAVLGAEMSRPEVLEVMRNSGPASTGLTFIWMPQLFARMPLGGVLGVLFFLGLSFAAFSSLISMIELATRVLVDLGVRRSRAVAAVAVAGFVLGVPSARHLGFFSNQDFVWGVGLMISGAFVAIAVSRYGAARLRAEEIDAHPEDWSATRLWDLLLRVLVPVQAAVLLVWWLYLSATLYAPQTWYDPFEPFSVMTCLAQWGLVLAVLLVLNRRLAARTLRHAPPGSED